MLRHNSILSRILTMPIEETKHIWMDGKFVKWEEAHVPVLTHALHYGTGVFEGIRAYPALDDLLVFRLGDHVARLLESAKMYYLDHGYTSTDLQDAILELLRINKIRTSAYIRPLIFVGYGGIGLNFTGFPIRTAIAAFPYGKYFEKPELKVCISNWRRISDESMPPQTKASGNYLNSVLAKLDALKSGYDDAILLDHRGSVSEGTGENVFVGKDGKFATPPSSSSILAGITRDTVLQLAQEFEIEIVEREVSRMELYRADEVFFTGTAAEVTAIVEVDRRKVGNGEMGKITRKIRDAYSELVNGLNDRHMNWITKVYEG